MSQEQVAAVNYVKVQGLSFMILGVLLGLSSASVLPLHLQSHDIPFSVEIPRGSPVMSNLPTCRSRHYHERR